MNAKTKVNKQARDKDSNVHDPKFPREVSRKFIGVQSLDELLVSVLQNQIDNMVDSIYDTKQASSVTSQSIQSEEVKFE